MRKIEKSINLVDEHDMYLYSYMFEAYGEDISVDLEDKGSPAGIPTDAIIHVESLNVVARNPARTPLDPKAVYQVIIIQKDIEES